MLMLPTHVPKALSQELPVTDDTATAPSRPYVRA
jgi:hypothetical protein